MDKTNTLTINGHPYAFQAGDTILDVARRNRVYVPTLCHLKGTLNTGACRVCLVEVEGARGLAAACAMPAGPDMKVLTESPKVVEARRFVIALLMVSGNHNCAVRGASDDDWTDFQAGVRDYDHATDICDAYGECELQALAYRYQVSDLVAEYRLRAIETSYPLEEASRFILRDFSRCILCGRCVKACNEIAHNNAISFGYRGAEAKVVTRGDVPLGDSDCVFCGECVQVCPVGALVEKHNRHAARPWDLERTRSTCGHCGTGCSIDVFTRNGAVVRTKGTQAGPVNHGSLCKRGRYGNDFVDHADRLAQPLLRGDGGLSDASWDAALDKTARSLDEILEAHGPDSVAGIITANATNEDAFAMRRYFTEVLGSPNLDSSVRMTDADAVDALRPVLNRAASAGALSDLDAADLILVAGADLTRTHPVVGGAVKRAAKRGADLILIHPGEPDIARHARIHLRPRPDTELPVLGGLLRLILDEGLQASEHGGETSELRASVDTWTPSRVEEFSGVPADLLTEAARAYAAAPAAASVFGVDLCRSPAAADLAAALADLALLCGNICISGGGVHPLRAQANTQGIHDLGCSPVSEGVRADGLAQAISDGRIKALIACGADPAVTVPGLAAAGLLDKLDLLVVHDLFPGETSRSAHVVLPATSFLESDGTFTNTERRVQRVRPAVDARGEARPAWSVFSSLSALSGADFGYASASQVFGELAAATPGYTELSHAGLDESGGAFVTEPARDEAALVMLPPPRPPLPQPRDYPYVLKLFETTTRPFHHSSVASGSERALIEVNPEDAHGLGLEDDAVVQLVSRTGLTAEASVLITAHPPAGVFYAAVLPDARGLARLVGRSAAPSGVAAARLSCAVKLQQ